MEWRVVYINLGLRRPSMGAGNAGISLSGADMQTIYRAADILEAHIVAGMLNAEGIEAEVAGFYQQGAVGELAPQDFARVMLVDERDRERAERLIADYESREPEPARNEAGKDDGESGRLAGWLLAVALVLLLLSWGVL